MVGSGSGSVTVTSRGIDVEKWAVTDVGALPAVAFEVTNTNDTPVAVRLFEPLPEGVDSGMLAVDPDYGGEGWQLHDDGRLELDAVVDPGTTTRTGYFVDAAESVREATLTEPEVVAVLPLEEGTGSRPTERVVRRDSSARAASDVVASIDDLADGREGATAGLAAVFDAADGPGLGESTARAADAHGGASGETDQPRADGSMRDPPTEDRSLVEALLVELESGGVPQEDVDRLGRKLRANQSRVTNVRLGLLSREVDDLLAYKDALEEFIDEEGTAADVLESVRKDVEALDEDLASVRTDVRTLEGTVSDRADRLARLERAVESLREDVETLSERTDRFEDLSRSARTLREDLDELSTTVDELAAEQASAASEAAVADLDARLADLEERVAATSDERAALAEDVDDLNERVGRIQSVFDGLAEGLLETETTEAGVDPPAGSGPDDRRPSGGRSPDRPPEDPTTGRGDARTDEGTTGPDDAGDEPPPPDGDGGVDERDGGADDWEEQADESGGGADEPDGVTDESGGGADEWEERADESKEADDTWSGDDSGGFVWNG